MTCPIKAATLTYNSANGTYNVTVDEYAAVILDLEQSEYVFMNGLNARDWAESIQSDLNASFEWVWHNAIAQD